MTPPPKKKKKIFLLFTAWTSNFIFLFQYVFISCRTSELTVTNIQNYVETQKQTCNILPLLQTSKITFSEFRRLNDSWCSQLLTLMISRTCLWILKWITRSLQRFRQVMPLIKFLTSENNSASFIYLRQVIFWALNSCFIIIMFGES